MEYVHRLATRKIYSTQDFKKLVICRIKSTRKIKNLMSANMNTQKN